MYEFESFVYLDVQKTGSSFIVLLLKKFCTEKLLRRGNHMEVGDLYDPSKFYFISIRDPLDQYISLYSYGCEAEGKLFLTLCRAGFGDFYDGTWSGFRFWLSFILDPESADLLSAAHSEIGLPNRLIGYQSYRFLALAVPHVREALSDCRTNNEVTALYKSKNITSFTVKYEAFKDDLAELLNTRITASISDLDQALKFIYEQKPRNSSKRVDRFEKNPILSKKQKRLLEEREWFIYENFGY